jgi:tRNA G46 methylase TrmB
VQVCINFPEPPHHSGDDTAESKLHLLTGEFFVTLGRVLAPGGKITVFSDNRKYCQSLCRMVGVTPEKGYFIYYFNLYFINILI